MARNEPLPYYKWLWRDWRANRKVQRMSWQAKGLYRELLDEFWVEGLLPAEAGALADICGCTVEEFQKFWPEIESCFEMVNGSLVNAKMDEQRTSTDMARTAMSRGGRRGGVKSNSFTRAQASVSLPLDDSEPTLPSPKGYPSEPKRLPRYSRAEQSRAEQEALPELGESPVLGLPVLQVPKLDAGMIQRAVIMETGLSGQNLSRNLFDVAESELRRGKDGAALVTALVGALSAFDEAKRAGKFTQFVPKPENFIGDGMWRDPKLWPWKEGHGPPRPKSTVDPLAEMKAQRAAADKERGNPA